MSLVSPSEARDSGRKCPDEAGTTDEMQSHIPQDYGSATEVQMLMGVNKMIVSPQASKPMMGIIQDSLVGAFLLTKADLHIPRHQFMDCIFSAGEEYVKGMASLFARARQFYQDEELYTGRVLFSALLPSDFYYRKENDASKVPDEPTVVIENGILIEGTIDKKIIGSTHGSIHHRLYKEYSPDRADEFLSAVQFLINRWLTYNGFSVGIRDFLISKENYQGVQTAIQKAYVEVKGIEASDDPEQLKEFRINNTLNNRGQALAINGLCDDNRLEAMINSGSKGSKMNIIQIVGHLGQNNVEGQRIKAEIDDARRTLPCFKRGNTHPRTRGFIENSFMNGLTPYEFWFHTKAGREGVINTAVKTQESGYASRKLVKRMEDMTVELDHTVRNSVKCIVGFSYGDSLDPSQIYNNDGPSFVDIDNLVEKLNAEPTEVSQASSTVLAEVNKAQRQLEIEQSIAEYKNSIKILQNKKTPTAKRMLKAAQKELQRLQNRCKTDSSVEINPSLLTKKTSVD